MRPLTDEVVTTNETVASLNQLRPSTVKLSIEIRIKPRQQCAAELFEKLPVQPILFFVVQRNTNTNGVVIVCSHVESHINQRSASRGR